MLEIWAILGFYRPHRLLWWWVAYMFPSSFVLLKATKRKMKLENEDSANWQTSFLPVNSYRLFTMDKPHHLHTALEVLTSRIMSSKWSISTHICTSRPIKVIPFIHQSLSLGADADRIRQVACVQAIGRQAAKERTKCEFRIQITSSANAQRR